MFVHFWKVSIKLLAIQYFKCFKCFCIYFLEFCEKYRWFIVLQIYNVLCQNTFELLIKLWFNFKVDVSMIVFCITISNLITVFSLLKWSFVCFNYFCNEIISCFLCCFLCYLFHLLSFFLFSLSLKESWLCLIWQINTWFWFTWRWLGELFSITLQRWWLTIILSHWVELI